MKYLIDSRHLRISAWKTLSIISSLGGSAVGALRVRREMLPLYRVRVAMSDELYSRVLTRVIKTARGFTSKPTQSCPSDWAASSVVPHPQKGSSILAFLGRERINCS